MKKTKKQILEKKKMFWIVFAFSLAAGAILIGGKMDFSKLSTSLISQHSMILNVPASVTAQRANFSFPIGIKGVSSIQHGKPGLLSATITNLPSNVSFCSATTSIFGWNATAGNISGGKLKVMAIGSKTALSADNANIININCRTTSSALADTTVKIKAEVAVDKSNNIYVLSEKSVKLISGSTDYSKWYRYLRRSTGH